MERFNAPDDLAIMVNDRTADSLNAFKLPWRLAKDLVEEHHLPWQSSQKNLTPGRVAQSLFSLLVEIGTPTKEPQPRGKSPGWKTGQKRRKRTTYPIAKKSFSRTKKTKKQAS